MTLTPDHITGPEAAELAGISPSTWRAYVARDQAPQPVGHVGRTPVWDRAEVAAWLAARPGIGARTDLPPTVIRDGLDGDTEVGEEGWLLRTVVSGRRKVRWSLLPDRLIGGRDETIAGTVRGERVEPVDGSTRTIYNVCRYRVVAAEIREWDEPLYPYSRDEDAGEMDHMVEVLSVTIEHLQD